MNITPLYELKDRLRAVAIAGTSLISEDFRLKKAAENFKEMESASPVFKKIGELTAALLSENCPDKPAVLLDTITLTDSVICTLGTTDISGDIKDIPVGTSEIKLMDVPYSKLSVITDALTASGGGKMEAVKTAWNESPELFRDFRVMPALTKGLGASYAELADYVQTIVGKLGAGMLPYLKKGFDPKGKKEMLRRVRAIEAITTENGLNESAFIIEQLETAEKDVRTALVYALRHNEDNIDKLIELAKTEKGKPKTAAMTALALFKCDKPAAFFEKYAEKKPVEVLEIIKKASSEWTSKLTAKLIEDSLVDKKTGEKVTYSQLTRDKLELKNGANRWTFQSTLHGKFGAEIEDIYHGFNDPEFAPELSKELGDTIAATGCESLKKLAVELNTASPMKGRYVCAEGVVRLIGGEDCSEWIRGQIHAAYDGVHVNEFEKSEILFLLRRIHVKDGKFELTNCYYDDISDGWIYDSPIPLDQPFTGAIADAMMECPCWQFDRLFEAWYRSGANDPDFRERLIKHFTERFLSPKGELELRYYLRLLGADKQKGLIRKYCETHELNINDLRNVIMCLGGDDNEYRLTETREVVELMRQGKLKTLSSENDIEDLAAWNEKRHGGNK